MQPTETITLRRDCQAVLIPNATPVTLKKGDTAYIVQSLGGFYTINIQGNLARIDGCDADVLGIEIAEQDNSNKTNPEIVNEDVIWEQLKTCYDPEIPINIVDLGLIYSVKLVQTATTEYTANITMTLTAPGCGMGEFLVADVKNKLMQLTQIKDVNIELSFDPPWDHNMMSEEARLVTGMY